METRYLYLAEGKCNYAISIGKGNDLIKTPAGNLLTSPNKKLIEATIYDLQRYDEIEVKDNHCISGEPLDSISFYGLLSTQIDFWNDKTIVTTKDFDIMSDPFVNISPGPEKTDQLYQWRSIIEILNKNGFDFYKLQYYSGGEERKKLIKMICDDFNNSSNSKKSVFINLITLYRSLIGSWCFCFQDLTDDAFATALKETVDFISTIEFEVDEEISNLKTKDKTSDNKSLYSEVRNQKTKEWFNKYLEVFNTCKKFIALSQTQDPLLETIKKGESKYIEFKESLSLDVRKTHNNKSYQPKKESYIELAVLKTIAGFLNSDGGELFIGIDDQSNVLGIKNELVKLHKSSKDKMQLHLKNLIKENIGSSFNIFINAELKQLNDQEIIHIKCDKSDKEVFIKGEDFYVRSGPSTDILKGRELLDYTKSRFN